MTAYKPLTYNGHIWLILKLNTMNTFRKGEQSMTEVDRLHDRSRWRHMQYNNEHDEWSSLDRVRTVDSESDRVTCSALTGTGSQANTSTALLQRHQQNLTFETEYYFLYTVHLHEITLMKDSERVRKTFKRTPTQVHQRTKPSPWTNAHKLLPWRSWYFTQLYDSVSGSLYKVLVCTLYCRALRQDAVLVWPVKMYSVKAFIDSFIGRHMKNYVDKTSPMCKVWPFE